MVASVTRLIAARASAQSDGGYSRDDRHSSDVLNDACDNNDFSA